MVIYPAIDLFDGKAVRLFKGDYQQMTIYNDNPAEIALDFRKQGAKSMHLVDLEGAKKGVPTNQDTIKEIVKAFDGFVELGGGIRSMETVKFYLEAGINRVILGTAAVKDPDFLEQAVKQYGEKIAVGVDIKEGYVAINGWLDKSQVSAEDFFQQMTDLGVKTIICTDISRDGAMQGANIELYKSLSENYPIDIIASGGVSSMEDIVALRDMNLHGAIVGKAYYVGAINLEQAILEAK
ncbi:MAG: 1-(5-phosphoribosyl)-5-[Clostridia bacterium]|nr:1-(5-phosphoribosyl)-5-[(5-phosphoribosylamino)methylideneamino]imidazole-4-carboxamide isomerase [Clostridia bacterium]